MAFGSCDDLFNFDLKHRKMKKFGKIQKTKAHKSSTFFNHMDMYLEIDKMH